MQSHSIALGLVLLVLSSLALIGASPASTPAKALIWPPAGYELGVMGFNGTIFGYPVEAEGTVHHILAHAQNLHPQLSAKIPEFFGGTAPIDSIDLSVRDINGVSTGKSFSELEPTLDKRSKDNPPHRLCCPVAGQNFGYADRLIIAYGIDWLGSVFKGDCKAPPHTCVDAYCYQGHGFQLCNDRSETLYVTCDYLVTYPRDIIRDISCNYAGQKTCGQEFDNESWNVVVQYQKKQCISL